MVASSCCALCNRRVVGDRKCSAFAYSEGVCYFKSCSAQEVVTAIELFEAAQAAAADAPPQPMMFEFVMDTPVPIGLMSAYLSPAQDKS